MLRKRLATSMCFAAALALLGPAVPAHASLATLKGACQPRDAAGPNSPRGFSLPYVFCDDGVPPTGGTMPNEGAQAALAVPERYGGDGYTGLPPKATPEAGSGADANGDIALDADVSLPDPAAHPRPAGGYPLVVLMHTCCAGDKTAWEAPGVDAAGEGWHYNNAWFAARGYGVLTYTSRGFVNASGRGSTGVSELDSRQYEVNDMQDLVCQLAGDPFFGVDPHRVVVTGGSYGGGLAWMALTDPSWNCATTGRRDIQATLAAIAPKYGWTDLLYSLVSNGSQPANRLPPTDPAAASSRDPFGYPRQSILAALYATGRAGQPPSGSHLTFPSSIDSAEACLMSTDPYQQNPLCGGVFGGLIDDFLRDRSAYYQNEFFARLARGAVAPVPVFSVGSLDSPLFSQVEHRRMVDRLLSIDPGYPVQEYYGDLGDFTQSKAKEWGDLCGADRHVCTLADYRGANLNASPSGLVAAGVNSRLNAFIDYYARPPGDPHAPTPRFDATAALEVCPANATSERPADEPGPRFTASTFSQLAPHTLTLRAPGQQTTTSKVAANPHAASEDPVANFVANAARCPVETTPAGPGVATYDLPVLGGNVVMIGRPRLTVPHTGAGAGIQLNARLYDVLPDGRQVLVDRGGTLVSDPAGTTRFDLNGNAWLFPGGDRVRVELAQDDSPYVKASNQPSTLTLDGLQVDLPVRGSTNGTGSAAPHALRPGGRCTSRRRVPVHIRAPDHQRLRSARVTVDGKRIPVHRQGRGLVAVLDLGGRPAGPVRVRIRARTTGGRLVRRTRTYRLCAPGRRRRRR
jgi:hypothetical protein